MVVRLAAEVNARLVKARARLLARGDRQMKADLIELRQAAGLTQADVAAMLGITQQAVNKLERYDSDPKLSTLRRYANAVGALIEHTVTADVGQSERLAADTRWEPMSLKSAAVSPVMSTAPRALSSSWFGVASSSYQIHIAVRA